MTEIEKIKKTLKDRIDGGKNGDVLTDPETIRLSLRLEELLREKTQSTANNH